MYGRVPFGEDGAASHSQRSPVGDPKRAVTFQVSWANRLTLVNVSYIWLFLDITAARGILLARTFAKLLI